MSLLPRDMLYQHYNPSTITVLMSPLYAKITVKETVQQWAIFTGNTLSSSSITCLPILLPPHLTQSVSFPHC